MPKSRLIRISYSRPLAQLTQFDQIMQIHSQQDPKLRTSSLFHANIQETSAVFPNMTSLSN